MYVDSLMGMGSVMHNKLIKRKKETLDAVFNYVNENNYSPSYRELANVLGLASSFIVSAILHWLKKNGFVCWEEGQPRTLRILKKAS
ncbi:transcriptional regulator [Cytobacillus purgationiresistens]|uniref:Repressor LexA n=1 Tax=Cytobacillus purgationiresistens TaxID=863449 RepID=A0ABU0AQ00_9BACI|nr:transcriptional regulator [Cytobacillus purgationiresistens]MDQ0273295.1 repressor LexA [Cytobacillus purgationiresistens]